LSAGASLAAAIVGVMILMFASGPVAKAALAFSPAEYFALAILGLTVVSVAALGSTVKGLVMGALGLAISLIGIDSILGAERYTFGFVYLLDGISFVPVIMGLYGIGEGYGTPGIGADQMFSDYEQTLFTRVVAIAERHGRKVMLLVAPGTNIFDALAQSAIQLRSSLIVVGESEVMTPERQSILLGEAWDRTPHDPDLATRLVVLCKDKQVKRYSLGAHVPDLSSADIERIHHLWVDAVKDIGPDLHHRDVVAAALATLEEDLGGARRQEAVDRLRRQASHSV